MYLTNGQKILQELIESLEIKNSYDSLGKLKYQVYDPV